MSANIDFGPGVVWSAHNQDIWLEFAGSPFHADHMRVVFVAYGRHHANGHARLAQGELAVYLIRQDGTLPDRRQVHRAIGRAVELGFLMPGSKALCLLVSSHHVQGGSGSPDRRCDRDHRVRRQKDVTERSHSPEKDITACGHSEQKDITGRSHLVLDPSSLLKQQDSVPEGHSDSGHSC